MRRTSALAPVLVLLIGLTVSIASGQGVVRTAERELEISLDRGASEIAMIIQSLTYGFDAELTSLAAVATVTGGDPALQQRFVDEQGLDGGYVLVDAAADPPRVAAAVATDDTSTEQQRATAEALLADPAAARQLLDLVDASAFGFVLADEPPTLAIAAGASSGDGSRYAAIRLFDVGEQGMFLAPPMAGVERFAVYVSDHADAGRAIFATTTELPLGGTIRTAKTEIGDQSLHIEVGGSPSSAVSPGIVTGVGIALTLVLAGLVSTALRRRDAAVRALAAASRAEQQFRAALLASPDVILRWNVEEDEIVVLNRESFYGHDTDRAHDGPDLLDIVVPEDRARVEALFRQGVTEAGDEGVDVRVRSAEGTEHWVRLRIGWMEPERRAGDLLVVVTDVDRVHRAESQRAAMEAELQQAQRMETIGQLAGGIAHDFNNLLAAISTTAELILSDVDDEATVADVEAILDATQRGAGLTKRLLSFSRRGLSRREEVEIDVVVADMSELLRRTLGEHVDLIIRPGAPGAHVLGDPGEIEQVLLNLVVNARDALDGPGLRIQVHTEVTDGEAALVVADDGHGMPADVAARAFEPFFSTKTAERGTGLGLSIVYGIATRMGGSVTIDSEPGAGTTVRVAFPTSDAPPSPAEVITTPPAEESAGEVVLLVEDEPAVRRAAQRLLERAGHLVVAAADGHEALTALDDGMQPTVLVTDVVLPGTLTGHDVAERVRARLPGVRVVYASGYSREVLTVEQLEQEHATFIAKPFTSRSLLGAVAGEHEGVPA